MKKILLPLTLGLLLTSVTYASKENRIAKKEARKEKKEMRIERRSIRNAEVAYMTEQHFAIDFPSAMDVSFERSKWFDEVNFSMNGISQKAFYDVNSELVGTTNKELFTNLPLSAQNDIKKWYGDYKVKEVIMFHDNETNDSDMIIFGSAFEDADNYFVSLEKGAKEIVLKVNPQGTVSYYTQIRKA
jgi:hypothetical protein